MKYIAEPGDFGVPTVELTERNLLSLLAKLGDPSSVRTLIDGENNIAVKAVHDEEHYADRVPGEVYMPTSGISL